MPNRKARALLAYLALRGEGTRDRSALAALLWPHSAPQQARTSLRQAIFEIRAALGPDAEAALELTKETFGIRHGAVHTDIAVALDFSSDAVPVEELQALAELLPGAMAAFEDIGAEFAEWLTETRNATNRRAIESMLGWLDRADTAEPGLRGDVARAALTLDEFNEAATRHLMRVLRDSQQSAAALSVYNDFFALLDDQLDAEPSEETQALAIQIKLAGGRAAPVQARAMDRQGVVVFPYEVLSEREDLRYVSLGLLDEVTCRLASNRMVSVVSSNSTRGYLGKSVSPAEARETFSCKYAVFGSLRPRAEEVSIATQVVDLENDKIVHALTTQRNLGHALRYEVELAALIANQISPNIDQAELSRTRDYPTGSLEPYHLVLRAKDLVLDLSHDSFLEAGALLDRAIAQANTFGPAYSQKADWYALKIWQRWSDDLAADLNDLEQIAAKAIEYSPGDGRARAILAHNRIINSEDFDSATALFNSALQLMPNDSETLIWTVPGLAYSGDPEGAIRNGLKALELSPLDPFVSRYHHFVSLAYYAAGQFREAATHGKLSFDMNPNHLSNLRTTIAALWAAGRKAEVAPLLEHHAQIFGAGRILYPNGSGPPYRDTAQRAAMVDHLKEAGLPV